MTVEHSRMAAKTMRTNDIARTQANKSLLDTVPIDRTRLTGIDAAILRRQYCERCWVHPNI